MNDIQEQIIKAAAQLLTGAKADIVIGFSDGLLPMRATPCFITNADDTQQLVWNSYCLNNLAIYLPECFAPDPHAKEQKPPPKVAIIAKGCDGRSAVGLIKEMQVPRENLVIIAVPCPGMLDAAIAQRLIGTSEIVSADERGDTGSIKSPLDTAANLLNVHRGYFDSSKAVGKSS